MWRSTTRGTATTIGLVGILAWNACTDHPRAVPGYIPPMADETEQGDYSDAVDPSPVGPGQRDVVQGGSLSAAFDPRQRIYRDPFNELVVFVISATGAALIAPVIMLIAKLATDELDLIPFIAACVGIELILIFGLARPAMKPKERVGWALLWGFSAAAMGAAFWELVYTQL